MNVNGFLGVLIFSIIILMGCNRGPKVIESSSDTNSTESNTGIFRPDMEQAKAGDQNAGSLSSDVHTVEILETLPATKYVYLNVKENNETYWIATLKKEVKPGEVYFYRDGLLKTNFESKEYNRVFEKIYLVSNLINADHGDPAYHADETTADEMSQRSYKTEPLEGSISIKELVQNKDTYAGQTIQISGTCVKLNPNIMDRHWIHLKDGSMDGYDLVVTSDVAVPVGQQVTMNAIVRLNKDFGAGYTYDLILEEGKVLQINQ